MAELVGRKLPRRELRDALDDAITGRGTLAIVSGEPGIGKTALVEELAPAADERDADVFWAACWDDEGAPAFWPWIQLLRALAERRGRDVVGSEPALAALIPDFVSRPPDEPATDLDDPQQSRFRLFDALTRLFVRAAEDKPAVLVLEDLHWADAPSLVLLAFFARELRGSHLLVVGTYRDVEAGADSQLVRALVDLPSGARRIALDPLTAGEVGELVGQMTGAPPAKAVAESVHRRTGGNPLFVREVVRLAEARGEPDAPAGSIPASVRAVIERRAARLPQSSYDALVVASVVGGEFTLDVMSAVCTSPVDDVLDVLGPSVTARLIVEQRPGRFAFAHALMRETIYERLDSKRRVELHRRVGEALESVHHDDIDSCAAELAHHFLSALPDGDVAKAVEYSIRAAVRASDQLAYEDAAAHYRRALDALRVGDEGQRVELLLALGEAELAGGYLERARAVFDEMAGLARRRDRPDELARAALGFGAGLGGFEVKLWDQRQIDLLEESLAALPQTDSTLRAWLLARLSVALSFVESERRRQDLSRHAVDMARRLGDRRALAYALSSLCDAIAGVDHIDERLSLASEMVELGRESGDRQMELLGRRFRVVAFLERGDVASVDGEIDAFARLADTLGRPLYTCYVPVFRGLRAVMQGRFEDAERLAGEADAVGRRGGSLNASILAITVLVWLYRERGQPEHAEARMRDLLAGQQEYETYPSTRIGMALLAADQGRMTPARVTLAELAADGYASVPVDSEWLEAMANAAELCGRVGDASYAAALYERLAPYAGRFAVDGIAAACFGSVSRHLGVLAAMLRRWDEAEHHFDDALRAHVRVGAPCLVADTRRNHAEMLLAYAGPEERGRALRLLDEAAVTYRELGADTQARRTLDLVVGREPTAPDTNVFRREGDLWALEYAARSARIKDSKGLRDLAALLAVPGQSIHVTELAGASAGEPALAADVGGDAVVLDDRARGEYRTRLEELEAEVDEAEVANDIERAARAREERYFLAAELAGALGLGGRSRRLGDPVERARKAVSMRIRLALDRMESVHPELARHLRNSVRTGSFCVYEPERRTVWSL